MVGLQEEVYGLEENHMHFYEENGYVIIDALMINHIKHIELLTEDLKQQALEIATTENGKIAKDGTQFVVGKNNRGQSVIHRIVWAGASKPALLEYARLPEITSIVADILKQDEANHLINQIHYKLPGDQVEFGWHKDIQNRQAFDPNWDDKDGEGSYVVAITAVKEHNEDNGPLYVIPGSHKIREQFKRFCSDEDLPSVYDLKQAKPLIMKPGDTAFMHAHLLHASWKNIHGSERTTFINGFSIVGANHASYPGEGSGELIKLKKTSESSLVNLQAVFANETLYTCQISKIGFVECSLM